LYIADRFVSQTKAAGRHFLIKPTRWLFRFN